MAETCEEGASGGGASSGAPAAGVSNGPPAAGSALSMTTILATWWPLAASWLLMAVEIPMVSAVAARLPDERIHLAAFGTVVFPVALIIESPIIMMLAASVALSRDLDAYHRLRAFMTRMAIALTLLQALVAFTPLFEFVASGLLGAPEAILGPSRTGLQLMLFWTWAIADRRFHQGVLIRFGRQHQVGIGTAVRLVGTALPLGLGLLAHRMPEFVPGAPPSGIVVIGAAMATGVVFEAVYARWCCRPLIAGALAAAPKQAPLETRAIWRFYIPLAMTPLLALLTQPIGGAGINRMPQPIASAAVWPSLNGLSFIARSGGVAYNEVVVRHAGEAGGERVLRRFAWIAGVVTTLLLLLIAVTPLWHVWFVTISGLAPELAELGRWGLIMATGLPLLSFLHSHYQGLLVHSGRTRGITEGVAVFLVVTGAALGIGVMTDRFPGAPVATLAVTLGAIAQAAWLGMASRKARVRSRATRQG